MLAIWRAVQEEIHCRGAKSVRQACIRLFENRADFLIKFIDTDGTVIDVINGAAGADTLRQRYQSAEKARHDAESYPVLHTKAKHLLKTLPGTYEKVQAFKSEQTRLQMTGKWPL